MMLNTGHYKWLFISLVECWNTEQKNCKSCNSWSTENENISVKSSGIVENFHYKSWNFRQKIYYQLSKNCTLSSGTLFWATWYVWYCLQRTAQFDSYPRTDPITEPENQPRNPKFARSNPHVRAEKQTFYYTNIISWHPWSHKTTLHITLHPSKTYDRTRWKILTCT